MKPSTGLNKKRVTAAFLMLFVLSVVLLFFSLRIGSVHVTVRNVIQSLAGTEPDETLSSILMRIRLPRALTAFFLGGALALSGYLLQTFFRNPIAGPFLLGISSGAKLFVAALLIFVIGSASRVSSLGMVLAAFCGSMLTMGFVLLLSERMRRTSMLIVCGIMVGYIASSLTDFLVTFADDRDIVNLHNWSRGSFSGSSWTGVAVIVPVVLVSSFFVFLLAKPVDAYRYGGQFALSVGVNVRILRLLLVILSSVLSAVSVAFAGPVSFVGVAVPHLMKPLFQTSKPIVLVPACLLGGGAFCLFCDLLARSLFAPTELNISTVTAVFGAPVVIALLIRRRGRERAA